MDIFVDDQGGITENFHPQTTIRDLKNILRQIAERQNKIIDFNRTEVVFNDGTKLSPIVLSTDNYDNIDLSQHAQQLFGGKIYVATVPTGGYNLYMLTELYPYEGDNILGIYDSKHNAVTAFQKYTSNQPQLNPTVSDISKLLEIGSLKLRNNYYNIREMKLNQDEF